MPSLTSPCHCHEAETPIHAYFYSMVELGVMRVFVEHRIFNAIPDDGISMTQLAEQIGMEYNLFERFTKFLMAARVLSSPAPGIVAHTDVSTVFRQPFATLFYSHIYDCFSGPAARWLEYFNLNGLSEPQRSDRSPLGLAEGHPDKTFYELLKIMPERAKAFDSTMALSLGDMPVTGIYNFGWVAEYARDHEGSSQRTLFVDVGGGKGQALKAILEENPNIPPSLCVLQDRQEVIEEAIEEGKDGILSSVKKIASSFFDEQPTKGALVYYIRRVLNDWPDDEAVKILSHVRAACAADSRVVISENLLPGEPSLHLAASDIWMMNFGGKRRNERMFRHVASSAGFKTGAILKEKQSNAAVIELCLSNTETYAAR